MPSDLDRLLDEATEPRTLVIDGALWERLMGWALATDLEVSGMGLLAGDGDDLRLAEAYLLPQRSNEVETQLDPAGLADLVLQLVSADVDPARLRLWWHSHARETAFWSGLDEHTIEGFAPVAMVALVVDHRARRVARLDRFSPRRTTTWLDVRTTSAWGEGDPIDSAEARADVERAVGPLGGQAGLRFRDGH